MVNRQDAGAKGAGSAPRPRERLGLSVYCSGVFVALFAIPITATALSLLIGLHQPDAAAGRAAVGPSAAALAAMARAPAPAAGRIGAGAMTPPRTVARLGADLAEPARQDGAPAPADDPTAAGAPPSLRPAPAMAASEAEPARPSERVAREPDMLAQPLLTALAMAPPPAPSAPVRPDAPPRLDPAARATDSPPRPQPAPQARRDQPEDPATDAADETLTVASLDRAAEPAKSDPAKSDPAMPASVNVLLYYGRGTSDAEARRVAASVAELGYEKVEARRVLFRIHSSAVRYFFDADRDAARRLHFDAIAGHARAAEGPQDFTLYRPSPAPGALALWLAD